MDYSGGCPFPIESIVRELGNLQSIKIGDIYAMANIVLKHHKEYVYILIIHLQTYFNLQKKSNFQITITQNIFSGESQNFQSVHLRSPKCKK